MIVYKLRNKTFPKDCEKCRLFCNKILGHESFCMVGGKYTKKEIKSEKDGNLSMYYHGCLSIRPKNCPLKRLRGGQNEDD